MEYNGIFFIVNPVSYPDCSMWAAKATRISWLNQGDAPTQHPISKNLKEIVYCTYREVWPPPMMVNRQKDSICHSRPELNEGPIHGQCRLSGVNIYIKWTVFNPHFPGDRINGC